MLDNLPEFSIQFVSTSLLCCLILGGFNDKIRSIYVFIWSCFFKPLVSKKNTKSQDQAQLLDQFYSSQAHIYDKTREILLQGRQECLRLAISHLEKKKELVWIDIGGGTGRNIEYMDEISSISKNFKAVYLVDLSESLCEIAKKRFSHKKWDNVHIILSDACSFDTDYKYADLITFSYSLSMIPTFNAAIDHAEGKLSSSGIIACADFGIQSLNTSIGRLNTLGGVINRHNPWIIRNFWRIWFEADRVFLDSARRNYLEYKFGTVKSINSYNNKLGKIPHYIWIGCDKSRSPSIVHRLNCLANGSPYLFPLDHNDIVEVPLSKGYEATQRNLQMRMPYPSIYYQKEIWRVYYEEMNPFYEQFKNQYIYAFTWEDPREDNNILKFSSNDKVLAITSAGDNILAYATLPNAPKRIHAVDLNPSQNHLLELKLAAFRCLDQKTIWSLFGEGKVNNFKEILVDVLSPHLSSEALQFWMEKGEKAFSKHGNGLYDTGSTRWALRIAKYVFKLCGVSKYIIELCNCETLYEQKKLWNEKLRPTLFNPIVAKLIVGNPIFLWKALGVPANQAAMMGPSVLQYVVDTLDPIINRSLISKDNYFYYLVLMGRYSTVNCPDYLTKKGHKNLTTSRKESRTSPIDDIRLHTDTLHDVLARLGSNSLTVAIIMDHMDWFDPNGQDAENEIRELKACLEPRGRVMIRSASKHPWYVKTFENMGFKADPVAVRESGTSIDRTNMYASTWVFTKFDNSRKISTLAI